VERQPNGGEPHRPEVNSYGTDDPETQAHIENARVDAARERERDRANLERLIELGMTPEDAELFIEFENYITQRTTEPPQREEEASWPTHDTDETESERVKQCDPRVYVADMVSAKGGISHGLWIDADQTPEELNDDIAAMLASSPTPGATEWAIQATEDFAGLDLHGYSDTELVSLLAKGVAEHGAAYSAWVAVNGTDDREQLEKFDDFYVGSYESREAWMRDVAADLGWRKERQRITDPLLSPYVTLDYAAMARDAANGWDAVTGIDGRLYVFMR
jgi:antirestriction protein